MEKNKLGLWIAAGLTAAAVIFSIALYSTGKISANASRVVSVKGLAEREVMADRAISPFAYKLAGNDLMQLYAQVKQKNNTVVAFLKAAGIDDDEITVAAPDVYDASTQQYASNDLRYNYIVTSVVTVCTDKVQAIIELQAEQGKLLEKGIPMATGWEYKTEYSFTKLNDIKPEMIEEATKNAREAAQKFAQDSESKLGKIKKASQGQISISDRDTNTPYIKSVRVVSSIDYFLND